MLARLWHAAIAAAVLCALALQLVVAIRVSGHPPDVTAGVLGGSTLTGRVIRVLSFFTIQSNLLSGITSAQLAMRPDRDGEAWRAVRLAALCGITVTGIVYSAVPAAIHEPSGPAETTVNVIVHYIVPIAMVVGWLAFGPRPRIKLRTVALSALFPLTWLAYTLVRGAIWKWYPYPFIEVTSHGYARVALNALLVTLVLALVAGLFAVGDRRLPAAPPTRATTPLQAAG